MACCACKFACSIGYCFLVEDKEVLLLLDYYYYYCLLFLLCHPLRLHRMAPPASRRLLLLLYCTANRAEDRTVASKICGRLSLALDAPCAGFKRRLSSLCRRLRLCRVSWVAKHNNVNVLYCMYVCIIKQKHYEYYYSWLCAVRSGVVIPAIQTSQSSDWTQWWSPISFGGWRSGSCLMW